LTYAPLLRIAWRNLQGVLAELPSGIKAGVLTPLLWSEFYLRAMQLQARLLFLVFF